MKSVSADNGKNTFCGYTRRECIYLGVIFLIVVFFRLCWSYSHTATWLVGDSYSYMNFNLVATLRLHAVNGRPPAYGCLLYLLHFLGDHYLEIVTLLQKLCSLAALPFFLGILRRVGLNTGWSGIVLLLYGLTPGIYEWDNCILTESFTLSGTVMFFYYILRYIQEKRMCDGVVALVLTVVLIFLRPQFLTYLAMLLVFFVWRYFCAGDKSEKQQLRKLLTVWGVATAGILVYCGLFYLQFGVFSVSDATPRQNLYVCLERGYYTEFTDQDFIDAIEEARANHPDSLWDATIEVHDAFGNQKITEQVNGYFRSHLGAYLADTAELLWKDSTATFYGYGNQPPEKTDGPLYAFTAEVSNRFNVLFFFLRNITIFQALVVALAEGVVMVWVWVRQKQPPWLHMALFAILMCTTFPTYLITCGEYMRTMITVLPYFFICMGMLVQWLFRVGEEKR